MVMLKIKNLNNYRELMELGIIGDENKNKILSEKMQLKKTHDYLIKIGVD